jgi:acetyl esterase/lipase
MKIGLPGNSKLSTLMITKNCLTSGSEHRSFSKNGCFRQRVRAVFALCTLSWLLSTPLHAIEPAIVLPLWPDVPPGEKAMPNLEHNTTKPTDRLVAGRSVIRLADVSMPTISVYPAHGPKPTGAAVLVCPGGAYNILAADLEGTEVCEWLNSIGITGVLLKYRVPKKGALEKHTIAFQDGQRAMGVIRSRAKEWHLNPRRIGVIGFSAGGHLAALLSDNPEPRTYNRVDEADAHGCRPDFTLLVYPAYLTEKDSQKIAPELTINSNAPPTFMVMTEDDPLRVESVLAYAGALKQAHVPYELHVYPTGGHGYGMRPTKDRVTAWPKLAEGWLDASGFGTTGND